MFLAVGDIRAWATLNPQSYEDIATHLTNPVNGIQNVEPLMNGDTAKTWEEVRSRINRLLQHI